MKKLWRSGMIDKKVVAEREQAEYINKLERVILELRREPRKHFYTSEEWTKRRVEMLKEHRDFSEQVFDWCRDVMENRPEYTSDIDFEKSLNTIRKAHGFEEK